ncbi:MAG: hypothetical protein COX48_05450 [bacterium (Candidatus Stahlbacteria) CG23_combo_of_CG06-09_8_20_14_all_34_7]|nr:MAG: hypothetical protein COX48_05450 [bacterium (Candidatus Stahlbacteria) CG23_combo_of_CG06-09_8_20_14_all_34_7]
MFFRTHQYPEIMILAMNRFYLLIFSILPLKKLKIHPILSLIYCNIVLFFVFLEIIFNLVFIIHPFEVLKRKAEIFRLTPNTTFNNFPVNEDGYMGRPMFEEKKERRILFIGDSFGVGVIDYGYNFIQMIEDSTEFECINLSQPGYSPLNYLKELDNNLKKSQADLVVIIIFVGNDIINISLPENNWSIENWKTINFIRNVKTVIKNKKNGGSKDKILKMTREKFLEVEMNRMQANNENLLKEEWNLFEKTIKKIKNFLDKENTKCIFIIIPDEYSVNENLQREITGKINIDWQYSINRVLKILTENGIDCLNTTGLLQESYSKGINPYKENDTHVNKTGNYIIFDNLRKKIHGVTIYLSP